MGALWVPKLALEAHELLHFRGERLDSAPDGPGRPPRCLGPPRRLHLSPTVGSVPRKTHRETERGERDSQYSCRSWGWKTWWKIAHLALMESPLMYTSPSKTPIASRKILSLRLFHSPREEQPSSSWFSTNFLTLGIFFTSWSHTMCCSSKQSILFTDLRHPRTAERQRETEIEGEVR